MSKAMRSLGSEVLSGMALEAFSVKAKTNLFYTYDEVDLMLTRPGFNANTKSLLVNNFRGWFLDFFFARVINNKLYYLKDNKII